VIALQELTQDVQHRLLVRVERRIRIREQRLGIGRRYDRLLGGGRRAHRGRCTESHENESGLDRRHVILTST
jgi:hypothetical protein